VHVLYFVLYRAGPVRDWSAFGNAKPGKMGLKPGFHSRTRLQHPGRIPVGPTVSKYLCTLVQEAGQWKFIFVGYERKGVTASQARLSPPRLYVRLINQRCRS
jgi:hypothetical protein